MTSDIASTLARITSIVVGAALTFFGLLLMLVYLDEGELTVLAWSTGFLVIGSVLLVGGAWSLLARLGIVAQGPVERLRAAL